MAKLKTISSLLICINLTLVGCTQTNDEATEKLNKDVVRVVKAIAQEDMYMASAVGEAGTRPEQWDRFQELKKTATENELEILTNHKNPAVRSYSFQALAERNGMQTFNILLEHLKDTASLETLQGCIGGSQMVGDFFLETVTPPYFGRSNYELSSEQRQTIDSILLFDDGINLWAKSRLISRLEPEEKYYSRIRAIYEQEKSPASLVALSKYRKEQDKQFIIDWLNKNDTGDQYTALSAVRNFIDKDFYPSLIRIHQQEIKKPTRFNYSLIRMMYFVLVQYKNPQTIELLEKTLQTTDYTYKYHSEYLWLALNKYPDPFFANVLNKIELTDYQKEHVNSWMNGEDY